LGKNVITGAAAFYASKLSAVLGIDEIVPDWPGKNHPEFKSAFPKTEVLGTPQGFETGSPTTLWA
jgi:hypothetical protein